MTGFVLLFIGQGLLLTVWSWIALQHHSRHAVGWLVVFAFLLLCQSFVFSYVANTWRDTSTDWQHCYEMMRRLYESVTGKEGQI